MNDENGLNDGHIHALCVTDDGDILVTTDQGISTCRTSGFKYIDAEILRSIFVALSSYFY